MKQRTFKDFKEEKEFEEVENGLVGLNAEPSQEIDLKPVDSVIMNLPFTRKESIAKFSKKYIRY
ncbi:MAG: hypothetical protein BTN85_1310 [Candidatus Methanohalarchaeum thermophilum]|uniref:Uncharacterized protein n=1 Tax=Methanohalarchaeum thermophilum TaxID=1903181 RepID=A0A1Q6DWS7_METT1|nr:MAG: hypothetical protein BTN85_1310 [Candidatus Methanohalarchaeum thermophilum]